MKQLRFFSKVHTFLHRSKSFDSFFIKFGLAVVYFTHFSKALADSIVAKLGLRLHFVDCAKIDFDPFRRFDFVEGHYLTFFAIGRKCCVNTVLEVTFNMLHCLDDVSCTFAYY